MKEKINVRDATNKEKEYFYESMKKQDRWITNWDKGDLMCVIESKKKTV
ncbi:hypothetical protein ACFLY2_03230 [Patescibacteria group bacterium]